ncbi:MAG: DNA recombination protein RmuC [Pseudomonadota bacterium]|nr:DNA recombination protein RmuC [Pseudomonadota bacterium]
MDLNLFTTLIVILFFVVLLTFVVVRNGASTRQVIRELQDNRISTKDTTDKLATNQGELAGRLTQLSETQVTNQNRLVDLMQSQERAVSKKLEERLADLGQRFGEGMEKSRVSQQTSLGELKERLVRIDAAQKNIEELSSQVVGLQDILSNKQARGAFGEVQLTDLVKSIMPPNFYSFQATLSGGRRVDCLLNLPYPPGPIAIDAKFPLESYRLLVDAGSDRDKNQARKLLATDVLKHVSDISEKYIIPGETAESALLFLPSEAVYAELHANLPDVIERSWKSKVWVVSPTTLMATLNTIRAVLKDSQMREQAHVIQREIMILLQDIGRLDGRVGKLENHFRQAEDDLRQIRVSTEKITKRGNKIEEIELQGEPNQASFGKDPGTLSNDDHTSLKIQK